MGEGTIFGISIEEIDRQLNMNLVSCDRNSPFNANEFLEPCIRGEGRYLKENPKGVQEMCKAMEDMRNEAALAERKEIARTFIMMGELSYEKIARGTKLSIEEIEKMAGKEIIYKSRYRND